ncbi:ProQ/FINO family protein [Cedecea sp. NFIX57]|uniref:ProQ/FINO family protein n=1 Tax=Cedecea sp. NFIX57 TaxID=1566286 RepID=UPI000A09FE77|nr:ProQ/FINO family protein [Cedecea sp. NFIX57]SMG61653.1 ProQ/FINO family protein [Cedecea sp. NFIX57]
MSHDRPVLSLTRKPVTPETGNHSPAMPARRAVIPAASASQVYQQKRTAREARDQKQLAVVPEGSVPPAPTPSSPGRPHGKPPWLMPVERAVSLFSQAWPALFEGQQLRPMKKGIREDMLADIAARSPGVSRKQVRRGLLSLTRSEAYVATLVSGSPRFGIDGQPAGMVTESEAGFSQRRVKKMKA